MSELHEPLNVDAIADRLIDERVNELKPPGRDVPPHEIEHYEMGIEWGRDWASGATVSELQVAWQVACAGGTWQSNDLLRSSVGGWLETQIRNERWHLVPSSLWFDQGFVDGSGDVYVVARERLKERGVKVDDETKPTRRDSPAERSAYLEEMESNEPIVYRGHVVPRDEWKDSPVREMFLRDTKRHAVGAKARKST